MTKKLTILGCALALGLGCGGGEEGGTGGNASVYEGGAAAGGTTAPTGGAGGTTAPTGGAGGTDSNLTAGAGGTMAGTGGTMAGAGGTMAGAGGTMAGAGGAGGTEATTREDLGEGDGNDVITIGDSYMNYISFLQLGTEFALEGVSGRTYRNYSVPGTQVLNGQIPSQWTQAVGADPDIKTVIMTGGGNDIILRPSVLNACVEFNQTCKDEVAKIQAEVTDLMKDMAAAGVEDVILLGYSYTQPPAQDLTQLTNYAAEENAKTCLSDGSGPAGLRCHFVDPVALSSATPPVPMGSDGIHPTSGGYDQIAGYVWDRMQAEGVRR